MSGRETWFSFLTRFMKNSLIFVRSEQKRPVSHQAARLQWNALNEIVIDSRKLNTGRGATIVYVWDRMQLHTAATLGAEDIHLDMP